MTQGAWILLAVLVLAGGFGAYRAVSDGRFRGTHEVRVTDPVRGASKPAENPEAPAKSVLDGTDIDHVLGERATMLQFSSAFCAPCRATRRILADVAAVVPGVEHIEVDAEHHLELVRRLGITRTPTTLILDREGRELSRASGAPRKEAVLASLSNALEV
ncbi:MAG TPA: thioredoxin family protein [Nocardioidaceae bacterium]|nr:thioredoxin family protein [Nocardioidaceae bacterium]